MTGDILRVVCAERTVLLRMPEPQAKAAAVLASAQRSASAHGRGFQILQHAMLHAWAADLEAEALRTEHASVDAEGARQLEQLCELVGEGARAPPPISPALPLLSPALPCSPLISADLP